MSLVYLAELDKKGGKGGRERGLNPSSRQTPRLPSVFLYEPAFCCINCTHECTSMLCACISFGLHLQCVRGIAAHRVYSIGHSVEPDDPFVSMPYLIVLRRSAREKRHALVPNLARLLSRR